VKRWILQHCFHLIGLWHSLQIQNLTSSSDQELALLLEFLEELLILYLRPAREYQVELFSTVYILSCGRNYRGNQEGMEKRIFFSQQIDVGRLLQSSFGSLRFRTNCLG